MLDLTLGLGLVTGTGYPGKNVILDFENDLINVGGLTTSLSAFMTFFRSTTASYTASDGYIRYAAIDEARIDYSRGRAGLFVEAGVTNLCLYSEQFSSWTVNTSATVDSNVEEAPDENLTADRINFSASQYSGMYRSSMPAVAGEDYVFSTFVKHDSGNTTLRFGSDRAAAFGGTFSALVEVDLADMSFSTIGSQVVDYGYIPYPNGWYRVWVKATATGTSNSMSFIIFNSEDTVSSMFLWGGQVEQNTHMSSYIPTPTNQVGIRGADNPSIGGVNFERFFNALEGTMVLDGTFIGSKSTYPTLARVDDGTNANRIGFLVDQSGTPNVGFQIYDGGAYQGIPGPSFNPEQQQFRIAGFYKEDDSGVSLNGSDVTPETTVSLPTGIDRFLIARGSGSSSDCNMLLHSFEYYPRRASNTEVELMSLPLSTLNFNFEEETYTLKRQSVTIDTVTASRSTIGTARDVEGNIVHFAIDEPRIDYSTGRKGYLIEEQRTNLVPFGDAVDWFAIGASITPLTENALNEFSGLRVTSLGATWHRAAPSSAIPVTNGTEYAITAWYRAGSSGEVRLDLRDSVGGLSSHVSGPVGSALVALNSAGTLSLVSEYLLPDGVTYELKVLFTPNFTGSLQPAIGPNTSVVGEDIIDLGMQVEQGSSHTSYIPTNGSSLIRAADVVYMDSTVVDQFVSNKYGGTLLAEFYHETGINDNQGMYYLSDGSYDNGIGCVQEDAGNNYRGRFASDGNFYHTGYSNPGSSYKKFATAFAPGDNAHYQNGSASSIASQMPSRPLELDRLYLGAGANGDRDANMVLYNLTYYPTRVYDDKLEELTT